MNDNKENEKYLFTKHDIYYTVEEIQCLDAEDDSLLIFKEDHDKIVAELKKENEELKKKLNAK